MKHVSIPARIWRDYLNSVGYSWDLDGSKIEIEDQIFQVARSYLKKYHPHLEHYIYFVNTDSYVTITDEMRLKILYGELKFTEITPPKLYGIEDWVKFLAEKGHTIDNRKIIPQIVEYLDENFRYVPIDIETKSLNMDPDKQEIIGSILRLLEREEFLESVYGSTWTNFSEYKLVQLDLSGIGLKSFNIDLLPQKLIKDLVLLDLSNNKIGDGNINLKHNVIRTLDLSKNSFTKIPTMSLPNINELHINHCCLTTISTSDLSTMHNLNYLSCQHNQLQRVEFHNQINQVNLKNNNINSIDLHHMNYPPSRIDLSINPIEQIVMSNKVDLLIIRSSIPINVKGNLFSSHNKLAKISTIASYGVLLALAILAIGQLLIGFKAESLYFNGLLILLPSVAIGFGWAYVNLQGKYEYFKSLVFINNPLALLFTSIGLIAYSTMDKISTTDNTKLIFIGIFILAYLLFIGKLFLAFKIIFRDSYLWFGIFFSYMFSFIPMIFMTISFISSLSLISAFAICIIGSQVLIPYFLVHQLPNTKIVLN